MQGLPLADRAKIVEALSEIEEVGFQALGCSFRMVKTRHRAFSDFLKKQEKDEAFRIIFAAERIKLRIARLVKAARLERKWSQAELARRVGTTQSVIARLESATDVREPSLSLLGRLAAALGFQFALSFERPKKRVTISRRRAPLGP